MKVIKPPYTEFNDPSTLPGEFVLGDHHGGFDLALNNHLLQILDQHARSVGRRYTIHIEQIYDKKITDQYKHLKIVFDFDSFVRYCGWSSFKGYTEHPERSMDAFVCCFNGGPHVSRKLLAAILHRFGWFDPARCSKNFTHDTDALDGHITDLVGERSRFYRKFFISDDSESFFQTSYSFGHVKYHHDSNIHRLEIPLVSSFVHVVSESLSTSYHPFVTEKFLYSVVTRGLYLSYAQPGWHDHLERYYHFRKYDKIFDYQFDSVINPVERLVELMSMLSKFAPLSTNDWHDLYLMEQDTVEYNYDHYFSGDYLKVLKSHAG